MTKRLETGVVQCGDDWPGVFIRGDHAFAFSLHLKHLLDQIEWDDFKSRTLVNSLIATLDECRVGSDSHKPEEIQHITRKESPNE